MGGQKSYVQNTTHLRRRAVLSRTQPENTNASHQPGQFISTVRAKRTNGRATWLCRSCANQKSFEKKSGEANGRIHPSQQRRQRSHNPCLETSQGRARLDRKTGWEWRSNPWTTSEFLRALSSWDEYLEYFKKSLQDVASRNQRFPVTDRSVHSTLHT